jgi:hypothetical protein
LRINKEIATSRRFCAFLMGIILVQAGMLQAQLIDVDFNNNCHGSAHGDPGPNLGPAMFGGFCRALWLTNSP